MSGVDTEEFASSLTRILFASSILLSQTHVSEKISQVTCKNIMLFSNLTW
jgi:hypothetical protein